MSQHPPVQDFATDFDHTDPQWVADPYPIWEDLRQRCPVAHTDRYGGAWLPVTQHGVAEVAYDTDHFTSRSVVMSEVRPNENDLPAPIGIAPPITSDPPFHALARRLLLPAFSPKPIAALEPFTRELCNELLDATTGKSEFDAAVDYAQHIPVGVIVTHARVPARRRRLLPQGHQDHPRRRRHVGRGAPAARRRRRARRVPQRADRRAPRPPARRPHVVPARRGARRPEAAPRPRARHDGPADGRGHRHHVVGDRRVAVAPRAAPRRSQAARGRSGAHGHRDRGVPARVRAGHDGPPRGQGLRVRGLPDEGGRLAAAAVPGRQPRSGCVPAGRARC